MANKYVAHRRVYLPRDHTGAAPVSFADGVTATGDATFQSASASFATGDVGLGITGDNIPTGTTIASRTSGTSVELSTGATADGTGVNFTIARTSLTTTLDPIVPGTDVTNDLKDSKALNALLSAGRVVKVRTDIVFADKRKQIIPTGTDRPVDKSIKPSPRTRKSFI